MKIRIGLVAVMLVAAMSAWWSVSADEAAPTKLFKGTSAPEKHAATEASSTPERA
jgi:hypothetical protein